MAGATCFFYTHRLFGPTIISGSSGKAGETPFPLEPAGGRGASNLVGSPRGWDALVVL
jgi:hypothetical protein